jgi:hypothetical protein
MLAKGPGVEDKGDPSSLHPPQERMLVAKGKDQAGESSILHSDRGGDMQDTAYELRRILLPRTPVNKG